MVSIHSIQPSPSISSVSNSSALQNIASGNRINSAADDAAGLAISQKALSQETGQAVAAKNTQDTVSVLQVADGALNSTHSMLQRMRELAAQASNGIYTDSDRKLLQTEFNQLKEQITKVGNDTNFNTHKLLDGSLELVTQVGANGGQNKSIAIGDMRSDALGISSLSLSSAQGANDALSALDKAIETVSSQRAAIGAETNALTHTYNNLRVSEENQQAMRSRISDADIAKESMRLAQEKIMQNIQFSVQAIGMQNAANVLHLLR